MAFIRASRLLATLFVATAILNHVSVVESNVIGDCWETWSRCSTWSNFFTGKLWKTCDECCKCKGREGGDCVLTTSKCPLSDEAYACHCYGSYGYPSDCSCYH